MILPLHHEQRLIVSLFDHTGEWAKPYIEAGYPVILHDLKHEGDILNGFGTLLMQIEEAMDAGYMPYGLLSAPPCDHITVSGAQYWPEKDQLKPGYEPFDSVTEASVALFEIVLVLRDLFPWQFWAVENPAGRLERLVPDLAPFRKLSFHPCDYGDAYTKRTILWGDFNHNLIKTPVVPKKDVIRNVSGWDKVKQKSIRSQTPGGFAKAFFNANK